MIKGNQISCSAKIIPLDISTKQNIFQVLLKNTKKKVTELNYSKDIPKLQRPKREKPEVFGR